MTTILKNGKNIKGTKKTKKKPIARIVNIEKNHWGNQKTF